MTLQTKVTGVILAGGQARRMDNQDKGLVLFRGRPLVSYGIAAMSQVAPQTVINANRNIAEYQQFGVPVITDRNENFDGPLAGILAGMQFAQSGLLLVMPCDSPLIQPVYLARLRDALLQNKADITVAFDGKRMHPVCAALKVELTEHLAGYLADGGRKMVDWFQQHNLIKVNYEGETDMFSNINTLAELAALDKSSDA